VPLNAWFDPSAMHVDKLLIADVERPALTPNFKRPNDGDFQLLLMQNPEYNNCTVSGSTTSAPCMFLDGSQKGRYNLSVSSGSLTCSLQATVGASTETKHLYALQASIQHIIWPGTPDPQDIMLCALFQCVQSESVHNKVAECQEIWDSGQTFTSLTLTGGPFPSEFVVFPQLALANAQVAALDSLAVICDHASVCVASLTNATKGPLFSLSLYGLKEV